MLYLVISCVLLVFPGRWAVANDEKHFPHYPLATDTYPLFRATQDGQVGYIDVRGTEVIPFTFGGGTTFSEGRAAVAVDGLWGFIDRSGNFVTSPRYSHASNYREGVARVVVNPDSRDIRYLNKEGEELHLDLPEGSTPQEFHEGMAVVRLGDGYGVIDRSGNLVVEPRFYVIKPFSEGLVVAVVVDDGGVRKAGFISKEGTFQIAPRFVNARSFASGIATGQLPSGQWVFINRMGDRIFEMTFDDAYPFSEGMARVVIAKNGERHFGFIDEDGLIRVPLKLADAKDFSEGLAAVKPFGESQWGYVNHAGQVVIEPRFDHAVSFDRGLARVRMDDVEGYIDREGNWVYPPAAQEQ